MRVWMERGGEGKGKNDWYEEREGVILCYVRIDLWSK